MPDAALTLAAVAALLVDPACGNIDARTPEGAALRDRMVAKFQVESGIRGTDLVHPFAIRDETLGTAVIPTPKTHAEAVAEATRRLALGRTLGLGLGQITGLKNLLADFGVATVAEAVSLAFDDCANVRASVRHYGRDLFYVMRVMDCASLAYNAGVARVSSGCDSRYVRSVRALQAALPTGSAAAPAPLPDSSPPPTAAASRPKGPPPLLDLLRPDDGAEGAVPAADPAPPAEKDTP